MDIQNDWEQSIAKQYVPNPSKNLANNIIASAAVRTQCLQQSFVSAVKQIFADFYLPTPAISLSIVLLFGLIFGYYDGINSEGVDTYQEINLSLILNEDGEVL